MRSAPPIPLPRPQDLPLAPAASTPFTLALTLTLALALALLLPGCAYRLGPSNGLEPGSRSIAVHSFENRTVEPRVTESLVTALRSQLQQEGSFRLARSPDADLLLEGEILSIYRREESFLPQDTRILRDYRLEVVAHVVATERGTGRKILDRQVDGHTTLRILDDMPSAERQAMPLLMGNLARNITSLLVDGDW